MWKSFFFFFLISLTPIGRAVLPNTPSARNVFLISGRGGKKRKSCAGRSSCSKTNVILTHTRVLEVDFHLSARGDLLCPLSLAIVRRVRACARDVRRRQRSSRADGVCQRDARAWRGEARGRSAQDASRQLGVENFRGKRGEGAEHARQQPEATRGRKMKGLPGSAPLLQVCATTLRL